MRSAAVCFLLVVGIFAGCVDEKPATQSTDSPQSAGPPGTVASTALTAVDESVAPTWNVGTVFKHHVFFGAEDAEGQHYNTIVTKTEGDSYFLATDDESAARDDAMFDIPIIGPVKKADLHLTGLGGEWDFYQFPMRDGLTWKSTFSVNMPDFTASWDLTHTATFNPAIETPYGPRPGYDIVAHTSDHEQLLFYDYVPDLGWYAHLFVYDVLTPEPEDFFFHVMSMGREENWKGDYFFYEGKSMLQMINGVAAIDNVPPSVPPEPFLEPEPLATFTMEEGSSLLNGIVVNVAVGGAHEMLLIDPTGKHHEFRAIGTPEQTVEQMVDLPSVPGEWKLVSVGAAVVYIEVAFLWQLTAAHGTL